MRERVRMNVVLNIFAYLVQGRNNESHIWSCADAHEYMPCRDFSKNATHVSPANRLHVLDDI